MDVIISIYIEYLLSLFFAVTHLNDADLIRVYFLDSEYLFCLLR